MNARWRASASIHPQTRENTSVIDRRNLRRMFLAAFEFEGLDYADGGCQIVHRDLTWSISLMVDGSGARAPYRLVLGASLSRLGGLAPRSAEDCYLSWPLPYEGSNTTRPDAPACQMLCFQTGQVRRRSERRPSRSALPGSCDTPGRWTPWMNCERVTPLASTTARSSSLHSVGFWKKRPDSTAHHR